MPTLTAIWRDPTTQALYERLVGCGKPPKLALTACIPKLRTVLNAILRRRSQWREPGHATASI